MDKHVNIYRLRYSIEKHRPKIDFTHPVNQEIDWSALEETLDGCGDVNDYSALDFYVMRPDSDGWDVVTHPEATEWDYYGVAGTFGLFSYRAMKLIGLSCFRHFDLIPAHLNEADYRFLRCKEEIPCFDLTRADVIPFDHAPDRIMEVRKYAFDKSLLDDPLFFCVPEPHGQLFVTEGVRQKALQHKLKGFEFEHVD
jgi:hypothetical protein